ncbi:hypothetical protein VNO77_07900 [Canavalia gladiata]|uniref:Uncharacterized protein n=1 Tax=Canavalia gladiata TaxID=3824 RepID=A0AAN9M9J0_CANGL
MPREDNFKGNHSCACGAEFCVNRTRGDLPAFEAAILFGVKMELTFAWCLWEAERSMSRPSHSHITWPLFMHGFTIPMKSSQDKQDQSIPTSHSMEALPGLLGTGGKIKLLPAFTSGSASSDLSPEGF